jgi:hypothetical protein
MAKPTADEIKEKVKEQDEEVYGEGSLISGAPDPESDDDVEEMVGEIYGEDAEEEIDKNKDTFTMAEEIEEDEKERHGLSEEKDQE